MTINYRETASTIAFHAAEKHIKALLGPFGSGKSCSASVEVLSRACQQNVAPDGKRYTRAGIIRATYPKLHSTTRKSLLEVLPPECGTITGAIGPARGFYLIPLPDGTAVHLELELVALPPHVDPSEELRSFNWSYAWLNEATELSAEAFAAAEQRIQRYPSQDLGGIKWGGLILDFNQPARGSWLDTYTKSPPDNMIVVIQPPAAIQKEDEMGRRYYEVNPEAENLRNLGSPEEGDPDIDTLEGEELEKYLIEKGMRYYRNQIETQLNLGREDIVQNLYCMLDVPIVEGKPVYSNFNKNRHVSPVEIKPIMFSDILIGMDQSGIHPAAVILQNQMGKWCVLDELYAENEGLENFLYGMLLPLLQTKYHTNPVVAAIDPSNQRDSWTGIRPSDRLQEAGIQAVTEITNTPKLRIQMVEHMLNLEVGGLYISSTCSLLIRGFASEYKFRRLRASGSSGAAYTPQPEKNEYSHIHDALQYASLLIHKKRQIDENDGYELSMRIQEQRRMMQRIV